MPDSSLQLVGIIPTKIVTYVTSVAACRCRQRRRFAVAAGGGGSLGVVGAECGDALASREKQELWGSAEA